MATKYPLRVLHLIDSGGLYGAERMLLALASETKKKGHAPVVGTIVSPSDTGDELGEAAGRRGLDRVAFRMADGLQIAGVRSILSYCHHQAIDVIHTHGYRPNIQLGVVPRKFRPCPIITTLHGWTSKGRLCKLAIWESLERLLMRSFDSVVVVSNAMRSLLPRSVERYVEFIPNGIEMDAAIYRAQDVAARHGDESAEGHGAVVLAIGRLSFEKGFDLLLDALARLGKERVGIRLLLAGAGPEEQRLRDQVERLRLGEVVEFLGFVGDTRPLYTRADLVIIPSRTEGLPLVLLEAMAAGVPVLASDVGQVSEVLGGGRCGMVVKSNSAQDLARGMLAMLQDPQGCRRMTQNAWLRVQADYSADVMSERYIQIYRRIAH